MIKPKLETMERFAQTQVKMQMSDRWSLIVVDGEMGEGKSCFMDKMARLIAKKNKTKYNLDDNMTYLRSELTTWLDGDDKGENKQPEYHVVVADELISMFFKRNWYKSGQISGIELLNKCRDRHFIVLGALPDFWDLDKGVHSAIRFFVHIPKRGIAWVFQKTRNPFDKDKWNVTLNQKLINKHNNPYRCPNFVCEIHFSDWTPKEKERYYKVRNVKRVRTENQDEQRDFVKDIKQQRNALIYRLFDLGESTVSIASMTGLSQPSVSQIIRGNQGVKPSA